MRLLHRLGRLSCIPKDTQRELKPPPQYRFLRVSIPLLCYVLDAPWEWSPEVFELG